MDPLGSADRMLAVFLAAALLCSQNILKSCATCKHSSVDVNFHSASDFWARHLVALMLQLRKCLLVWPQEGRSASAIALAEGHADLAQLLMSQTGRPQTARTPSLSQSSETPSAPPWTPQSPHEATLHRPTLPHARSSFQQGLSPHFASAASARPTSSAASTSPITYPAVYASSPSSQQPSAEAILETDGSPRRRPARPGPSAAPDQPQQGRLSGSDSLQAEATQAEAPRMGYGPAAVSFMMARLQVRCLLIHDGQAVGVLPLQSAGCHSCS